MYFSHIRSEALSPEYLRVIKNKSELHCETLMKRLRSDKGGDDYDPSYFHSTSIIHEVILPYTP